MPNWCDTRVTFVSTSLEVLENLYDNIDKYMSSTKNISKYQNSFGNGWLGNQALEHGLATTNSENEFHCDVGCRGCIEDIDEEICSIMLNNIEYYYFQIYHQYDAWSPNVKLWKEIINKKYPGVDIYYQAYEPGCRLYWTNDTPGYFYPEMYVMDCYLKNKSCLFDKYNPYIDYQVSYFNSDKEALSFINRNITSKTFETPQQAADWIENELNTHRPAFTRVGETLEEDYFNLNQFKYVDIDDTE